MQSNAVISTSYVTVNVKTAKRPSTSNLCISVMKTNAELKILHLRRKILEESNVVVPCHRRASLRGRRHRQRWTSLSSVDCWYSWVSVESLSALPDTPLYITSCATQHHNELHRYTVHALCYYTSPAATQWLSSHPLWGTGHPSDISQESGCYNGLVTKLSFACQSCCFRSDTAKSLVNCFVISRIDYCNSLLTSVPCQR